MIDGTTLPTIRGRNVVLRWLTERDVPALYAVFSDPEVMAYWSSEPMQRPQQARALLEDIHDCFARRTLFQWGVAIAGDDRVVGTCTLFQLDARNRRCEVGYALARDQWGRGLMSDALGALLEYAFTSLGLLRIEADVDPRNQPSLRLLERLGFVREGLLRERWRVGGGVQDAVLLGLLERDWRAVRASATGPTAGPGREARS